MKPKQPPITLHGWIYARGARKTADDLGVDRSTVYKWTRAGYCRNFENAEAIFKLAGGALTMEQIQGVKK